MLKVHILKGEIENNDVSCENGIEWVRDAINRGEVVIVRGCFQSDQILKVRKYIHQFGLMNPQGNPERSARTEIFHRIDDNHPKMSVKRIAHFFRFSYSNKGDFGIFEFFEPMNHFRNAIAGLNRDFTFYSDDNGYLSQPAVLHYPSGGGYLQTHVDPVEPQIVEMVLAASERGRDFKTGGIQVMADNEWEDIEGLSRLGDLILFRPDIPHRVAPIDEESDVDWTCESGRWIIFSPIANIKTEVKNEKALPY